MLILAAVTLRKFLEIVKAALGLWLTITFSGITTLFDNIGKTYLVPGFDYRATDKKAQEDFLKKKQEEDNKNEKKKREKRGMKLETKKTEEKKEKKCC